MNLSGDKGTLVRERQGKSIEIFDDGDGEEFDTGTVGGDAVLATIILVTGKRRTEF